MRVPAYRSSLYVLQVVGFLTCSFWGCGKPADENPNVVSTPVPPTQKNSAEQSIPLVVDPNLEINSLDFVINRYAKLSKDANAGTFEVTVDGEGLFDTSVSLPVLKRGDLILIMQMQGAAIQVPTDAKTSSYGDITDLRGAGMFEFIQVSEVDAANHVIRFDTGKSGLQNSYVASGHVQVIRVPFLRQLTIKKNASVTAPAWNGDVGGIVVIRAQQMILEDATGMDKGGKIDVSGKGFRGGSAMGAILVDSFDQEAYYGQSADVGGQKGEGIAGGFADCALRGDCFGRGAVANGGGGGNSTLAGGGGGGNGSLGVPTGWGGRGHMDPKWTSAWKQEVGPMGMLSTEAGGGRGGYSLSVETKNPDMVPPGHVDWGGNYRRNRGGFGGRPMNNHFHKDMADKARVFMGGGGGAGSASKIAMGSSAGSGGAGGGIVLLFTNEVQTSSGLILADGTSGNSAVAPASVSGGGGGGAGGTVIIQANDSQGLTVYARGGNGGDQSFGDNKSAAGPGGGGSGGYIAISNLLGMSFRSFGGQAGQQKTANGISGSLQFPVNGATNGTPPSPLGSSDSLEDLTSLERSLQLDSSSKAQPGGELHYKLTIKNTDPVFFKKALVGSSSPFPANTVWTCTVDGMGDCGSDQGVSNLLQPIVLGPLSQMVFDMKVSVAASIPCSVLVMVTTLTDPDANQVRDVLKTSLHAPINVDLVADPSPADGLSPVNYTIRVSNTYEGCNPIADLKVRFVMPSHSIFLSMDSGTSWSCQQSMGMVTCDQLEKDPLSLIQVSMLPPSYVENMQADVSVYGPFSQLPAAYKSLQIDISNQTQSGVGGGGFSCSLSPGNSSSGFTSLLWMGFPLLIGLLKRRRFSVEG